MSKGKFVLNPAGVREILKSAELQAACEEQARAIASRAGDGFSVVPVNYPERAGAKVVPTTREAFYRNLRTNALLKAVGK